MPNPFKWASDRLGGGDALSAIGSVLSFIPGMQPWGAAAGALGGLLEGQQKQGQADKLQQDILGQLRQQMGLTDFAAPYWKQALADTAGSPYGAAGQEDPYSPALNELRSGAFRDDTAKELQRQLSAVDYHLRPQGGMRSSAMEYARSAAIRDASTQNAAFARNLRIQGGVERFNNARRESDERFRRLTTLLQGQPGAPAVPAAQNQYQLMGANTSAYQGDLADTIKAIMTAGGFNPKGPQGGNTGTAKGSTTIATDLQVPPAFDPNIVAGQV